MTKCMDKANLFGHKGKVTRVHMKEIWNMVMVKWFMKMEVFTKETGIKVNKMAGESWRIDQVEFRMEIGREGSS